VVFEELLSDTFVSRATCLSRSLATLLSWKMETTGFVFHKSTLRLHTTLPHLSLAYYRSSILSLESMASNPSYVWLWSSNKINYCAIETIFKCALNSSKLPCDQNATDLCTTTDVTPKSDVASHNHQSETRRAPPHSGIGGILRNIQGITTQGFA